MDDATAERERRARKEYKWAIEIVRKHFSHGLEGLCEPQFLADRHQEFERKNDPIYGSLLRGMDDAALAKTFVSYWTIAQTMATQSRFWLEDAIAEIVIHQVRHFGRKATKVYSQAMLSHGFLDAGRLVADIGENELEHLTARRAWRPELQEGVLERIDVLVGQQERQRVESRDPERPRAWNRRDDGTFERRDREHLAAVTAAITGPPVSEVPLQCNLLVVEPDRHDGRVHAWALRFVNPKTLASHAARKQERVNLLRLYALLVQQKILRDPKSIHVGVAELVPRSGGYVLSDRWPDYFSAATHWSSEKLWTFIDVPYEVLDLALKDVAKEFRKRLRAGLKDLLPSRPRRVRAAGQQSLFGRPIPAPRP